MKVDLIGALVFYRPYVNYKGIIFYITNKKSKFCLHYQLLLSKNYDTIVSK